MTENRLMCWHGNFVSLPWHICIYLACVSVCLCTVHQMNIVVVLTWFRQRVILAHNFSKFRVIFRFEYVDCCCPNAGFGAYDLYLDPICTSKCAINLYNAICSNFECVCVTWDPFGCAKWKCKMAILPSICQLAKSHADNRFNHFGIQYKWLAHRTPYRD